jgi:drug/metabolite transporter (DMT)-like permease
VSVAATTPTTTRATAVALVALVLGAVCMGASPLFVRWAAAEGVGPFASAFWRVALAVPALWLWAAWEGRRPGAKAGRGFTAPVLVAGVAFAGDLFFWHLAILNTTIANATFLATTAPVWVMLGTVLVLRERVTGASLAGLALCLAGGVALLGSSYSYAPARLVGDLYGILTAVFFGATILAVARATRTHGAARISFLSTVVTAAILLAVALAIEERVLPATAAGWGHVTAMAMISQVAGQGLMALALVTLPAVFSSLVIFFEAVAAAAFGWLFFGETLGLAQTLGGVMILLGIWVARPRAGRA